LFEAEVEKPKDKQNKWKYSCEFVEDPEMFSTTVKNTCGTKNMKLCRGVGR